ncbi:MAG: TGS domain-containing protein [Candidatus Diapherotrites archaeon]|nr:TGS domain-containing protein [Candidatus Diapherotrites archaeon]
MPVNAGVDYGLAEQKYLDAKTPEEKLSALYEMVRTIPKHKGTEKARKELSGKIAKLKSQMEKVKATKKGSGANLSIKKDGCGQIVIVGMPNSGKSHLLNFLTNSNVKEATYAFTTKKPEVAAMDFIGAKVQLIEVPAVIAGSSKGKANGFKVMSWIRTADAVILLASNPREEKILLKELKNSKIYINLEPPKVFFKQAEKGISFTNENFLKMSVSSAVELLKTLGVHKASILLNEPVDEEKLIEVLDKSIAYMKAIIVNGLSELNKDELKEKIFGLLNKILVYTKKPGGKPDFNSPLVLNKGATIDDLANSLHKDFAKKFKYACVTGSTKYENQRVSRDYQLQNRDVVEIYA